MDAHVRHCAFEHCVLKLIYHHTYDNGDESVNGTGVSKRVVYQSICEVQRVSASLCESTHLNVSVNDPGVAEMLDSLE